MPISYLSFLRPPQLVLEKRPYALDMMPPSTAVAMTELTMSSKTISWSSRLNSSLIEIKAPIIAAENIHVSVAILAKDLKELTPLKKFNIQP